MTKSLCLAAVLACTLATIASSQCLNHVDCEQNCRAKKEQDVLDACHGTLSLKEIDNRDLMLADKATPVLKGPEASAPKLRSRSVAEMQPYLLAYGLVIASVSPLASCYQLVKLNPQVEVPFSQMLRLSLAILPQQAFLKELQMTIATPIKKNFNPWAAFALIGVLQGGLYGHSNVHFANSLHIGTKPSLKGVFRGVAFAGTRDLVSQGFPFVLAPVLKKSVFDVIVPSKKGSVLSAVKHWISVFSMSVMGTYISQGFHNSQITMQSNPDLGYFGAVKKMFAMNGFSALYKGAEARVGLLLVVAFLNEVLLKKAWQSIPDTTQSKAKAKPAKKNVVYKPTTFTNPKLLTSKPIPAMRRNSIGHAAGPATVPQAA